ncbi:MAG: OmpA family protein, partial [Bacteroidota bacterium]
RPNKILGSSYFATQINSALGVDWGLDSDWKLRTEINYRTVMDNKFDGVDGPSLGGLFGGPYKSYLSINVGFNYYLAKGEPSKYCQLYSGISSEVKDPVDYGRIEEMIKRHIPKEVIKEVVVDKPMMLDKWVLVGVNFDFNSAKLTAESYPILYDAAKTLLKNPQIKVEIQGYTDNIGSESYNKKLAQKRADVVKNYLVSKGVAAARLNAVGYGESSPVADNKTSDGRAMNRRIEFKTQ